MIREASLTDIPGIIECLRSLSTSPFETKEEKMSVVRAFKERMECGNIFTYVYEDKGEILGTITILMERKLSHCGGLAGYITDVAVRKNSQKKGVGTELTDFGIEFIKSLGAYKRTLNCSKNLQKYYEKFGFEKSGYEMRMDVI